MKALSGESPQPDTDQPSVELDPAAEPEPVATAEPEPGGAMEPITDAAAPVTPEDLQLLRPAADPVESEHLRIEQLQRLTKLIRKLKGLPLDPPETS